MREASVPRGEHSQRHSRAANEKMGTRHNRRLWMPRTRGVPSGTAEFVCPSVMCCT